MSEQTTNHILMIRPVNFMFNVQTAENNKFQQAPALQDGVQAMALKEFDDFAALLSRNGVDVTIIDDTLQPETPDSIFPNNWISFHKDAGIFLYPMFSENRRMERRQDIIDKLQQRFNVARVMDLSRYETEDAFLEGTGSMVLDRENRIAYACLSVRTDEKVLADFCEETGYTPITFKATDAEGFPIYHTNVMMCIGTSFAVICLEAVPDQQDKQLLIDTIAKSGKELVEISLDQMNHFAGNMLEISNESDENLLIMSEQAHRSLKETQLAALSKYCHILSSPLDTIEKNGGGSARCMLAEIHLEVN